MPFIPRLIVVNRKMGSSKSKESSPEVEVDKTNNNIGLVNLEENNVALLGPVEIALIILMTFAIGFILRYCQKKCKKSTVRSVQEGLSRNQENLSNMSRPFPMTSMQPSMQPSMPMQVPMPLAVTFQEPGCRVVTTAATAPSVQPLANTSVGLWDQCK